MVNEFVVMMVMYHLICFTPFVPEIETRFNVGYVLCVLIGLHLAANLALILQTSYRGLRRKHQIRAATKYHKGQRLDLKKKLEEGRPERKRKFKEKRQRIIDENMR